MTARGDRKWTWHSRLRAGAARRLRPRALPPLILALGVVALASALVVRGIAGDRGPALPAASAGSNELLRYEQSFGPVQRPTTVAVDEAGFVYVVDSDLAQVTVFRPDGTIERTLGSAAASGGAEGDSSATLASPLGIAIDPGGRVFVSDLEARRIVTFTREGRYEGTFAAPEIAEGAPGALLFHEGKLYVCDLRRQAVLEFDANGLLLRTITGGGSIRYPNGVWAWPDGALTVADTENNRLLEIDSSGGTVRVIEAGLLSPRGVSADSLGHLFVASPLDHRVAVLERTGVEIDALSAVAGQGLGFPTGVAVSGDSLYVTDRAASAVHRWRINAS